MSTTPVDVDAYVAALPEALRPLVEEVRAAVRDAAPGGLEVIRYGIPTVSVDGRSLVHYAAWQAHLSLYPPPARGGPLEDELAPYRSGKGTLRFPYAGGLPLDLVARVVHALLDQRTAPATWAEP